VPLATGLRAAAGRLAQPFPRRLAAIAALGLALRLFYVMVLSPDVRPEGDSDFYYVLGRLIAEGHGFANPVGFKLFGRLEPTALHPPLYPLLLGGVAKLGVISYYHQRIATCAVGVPTIALVGFVARRVAGDRGGLIAAAIAAVHPMLVTADGAIMSEALFGMFTVAVMAAAYALADHPSAVRAGILGVLIALTALTRAEGLLLLPLVAVPVAVRAGSGWPLRVGVATAACVIALVPWTIRNADVFDRFVPISNNNGSLLAGANCPFTYAGPSLGTWDLRCIPRASGSNEAATAAIYRKDGLDYATDHAGRLPIVLGVRVLRTLGVWDPIGYTRNVQARESVMTGLGLAVFLVLLPLAVVGAVLLRRRGAPLFILAGPVVVALASVLGGYGEPRFREPAELSVVILAAVALAAWWAARAGDRPSQPAPR
jgi:4-amino-4-deoxy-L-arabinose transferase-like glycosyltransferase